MARTKLKNLNNGTTVKAPTTSGTSDSTLTYGEIAVNYVAGDEALYIRNTDDTPVSFFSSAAFRYGCTNTNSLSGIGITTRLVYATLKSDQTLSFAGFNNGLYENLLKDRAGFQVKIIAYNSSSSDITIKLPWSTYTCFVSKLILRSHEYGVITVEVKSTTEIYIDGKIVTPSIDFDGTEGILALSDGNNVTFVENSKLSTFKTKNPDYVPIGYLIIPASCSNAIYSEGDSRRGKNIIMSLCYMSATTSSSGIKTNATIAFGQASDVLPQIVNSDGSYPGVVGVYASSTDQDTLTTNSIGYLPSDAFTITKCKANTKLNYSKDTNLCPPPYILVDGEYVPNEAFFTTFYKEGSSKESPCPINVCSFVDGLSATSNLIKFSGSEWKDVDDISSIDCFTAACACANYKTKGTSAGDWYLPAVGELSFAVPIWGTLGTLRNTLNTTYSYGVYLAGGVYWTSTPFSTSSIYTIATNPLYVNSANGTIDYTSGTCYCRAFCAV